LRIGSLPFQSASANAQALFLVENPAETRPRKPTSAEARQIVSKEFPCVTDVAVLAHGAPLTFVELRTPSPVREEIRVTAIV
jgi:hypothetical protein